MVVKAISKGLIKVFGSRNDRVVKAYLAVAAKAGEYEQTVKALSDEALKGKTAKFKEAIAGGTRPDDLLPEAFAVVREAGRRNMEMRHYDVQLVGGNVLYDGKIAEMATGEGKTLVATLAAYLVHLTGKKVHIITVNDYLAKRDAEWMTPVYEALGLTVGAIQADMDTSGENRKAQYACDITYGTNNEFGFDYLRDNMKTTVQAQAQGPLEYAIVDEVDSILIDEARTPLIISGPAFDDVTRYKKADAVTRQLINRQSDFNNYKKQIDKAERELANAQGELNEAKKVKDTTRQEKAQKAIDQYRQQLDTAQAKLETCTEYYEVEIDRKQVHLTHEGIGAAQEIAGIGSFFTGSNMEWPHMLEQSLRAHVAFEREKDYVVMDGKVVIVDEFTGRLMQGRQWSDGLHQAVEAKENVQVKEESQTLATITLQNFFKLYEKISGMTGTADTEADEFMRIYQLDVVVIPTNRPCVRDDREDVIYKSLKEKFDAIVENVHTTSAEGRPVLIGTISIEKSEALSNALQRRYGLEHEVLNAKQHGREAQIVAKAGEQHTARDGSARGNVTIATNMAGRGTDIKLGQNVAQIGGLHILGTERHEARRIDNQLRGRAGRQGDLGSSQFFLSFDDDLLRIFAGERTVKWLALLGWEEGEPIYHKRISKGIEKAQKKVEERNFEIRKSLLEYDEVMDYQRKTFYTRRQQVLAGHDLKSLITEMIESAIYENGRTMLDPKYASECILDWARNTFDVDLKPRDIQDAEQDEIEARIKETAKENVTNKIQLSMGEYLEDDSDPSTWDAQGLSKWAMSSFKVNLNPGKVKQQSAEETEQMIVTAACELVDRRDCAPLAEILDENFALHRLIDWASTKFAISLKVEDFRDLDSKQIEEKLKACAEDKYRQREIEYPVEFAMGMVIQGEGVNVYGFDTLAQWANRKYGTNYTAEQLQNLSPKEVLQQLQTLSRDFHDHRLAEEIRAHVNPQDPSGTIQWANQRFGCELTAEQLDPNRDLQEQLQEIGRNFLRRELSDLERYVLLQVYDSTWKDHLYTMDRLKESIWTRSFAEKDPKTEYKREGYRLFDTMLHSIEEKVTDIIFRVHLEAGSRAKSVWNVSQTSHDQVGQFAATERQRAAAQAPQGDGKVKQIKLETPKVGRNDSCPCGSGKKYKKCCGQE